MEKECVGCNRHFDEHDDSEIFVCSKCKNKYIKSEQKRIFQSVCSGLKKEAYDLLIEAGAETNEHTRDLYYCGASISAWAGCQSNDDDDAIKIVISFTGERGTMRVEFGVHNYEKGIKSWATQKFKEFKRQKEQTDKMIELIKCNLSGFDLAYKKFLFREIASEFGFRLGEF